MPSTQHIHLFGVPSVGLDGQFRPLALPPKALALLGYLACRPTPATRVQLAALLWGETTNHRSRRNLTHTLGQISELLPGCIHAGPQVVGWATDSPMQPDVRTCADLFGQPDDAESWLNSSAERIAGLERGVVLYRGELLEGLAFPGCAEFETWLSREREHWQRQMIACLFQLVKYHAHQHHHERAEPYARRLIELEPWHEEGHRALMLLLAARSRRGEALVHYERLQRMLAAELGLAPDDETRTLAGHIRDGTQSFGHDEAVHKERVPAAGTVVRRHLPRAVLPFIGRQRELDDLTTRLCDPSVRLITLVAPGGMGKTRLAFAAAEQLAHQHTFCDGVAIANLTSIHTTAQLEITLSEALGLPLDSHGLSPRHQLLDYLQSKHLLLLLDNCEHLLEELAALVAAILHEAPAVVLLATSRERLGLQAERVLPLDGMDPSDDGAALFASSACCARPGFALDAQTRPLVQGICARLSGMPLAIELAARWTNTLSLAMIRNELANSHALLVSKASDRAERHRSIRNVCEATWAQLQPIDQSVFAQMAVFRGGATRQAIQAVTGATLDQLQTLVEQALIRFDPRCERYAVHEVLRQYAEEQLRNDVREERAARERHAAYFLGRLSACEGALKGGGQWETLASISAEIENLRAAWHWGTETGSIDLIVGANEALSLAYVWLGHHVEGLAAMGLAVQVMRSAQSQTNATQATLLASQARFARLCGNHTQALDLLGQAQSLLAANPSGVTAGGAATAMVLLERGRSLAHQDFTAAHHALTRSQVLWEMLDDHWWVATTQAELGYLLTHMRPSYSEAKAVLEQSVAGFRALGDQIGLSEALMHLCRTYRNLGLFPDALAVAREVYTIAEANGNVRLLAQAEGNLGTMLAIGNQYQEATARLAVAVRLTNELGRRGELPNLYCAQGYVAAFLGNYRAARTAYNHGLHIAQQMGDELERCSLLSGLAGAALAEGAYTEALNLADEALALSDRLGEGYLRSRSLPYRALALRGLGIGDCGRGDILATLRLGLTAHSEILVALWGAALLLADAGETMRAAEVFALSERQRQLDNAWLQDIGLRELRAIIERLPSYMVAQGAARWTQCDVWSALEELCAELAAG